ncbi:MAG: hypothetical protein ABW026_03660, partial [Microvirga sp.]
GRFDFDTERGQPRTAGCGHFTRLLAQDDQSPCDQRIGDPDAEPSGEVTESGMQWLAAFGVEIEPAGRSRRLLCRPCLDWSERRPHLAGRLGAALSARCEELGWIERQRDGRALRVTDTGQLGFASEFGLPQGDDLLFVPK